MSFHLYLTSFPIIYYKDNKNDIFLFLRFGTANFDF